MTEVLILENQSIDLKSKSVDWFLYDRNLRHETVNDSSVHIYEVDSICPC